MSHTPAGVTWQSSCCHSCLLSDSAFLAGTFPAQCCCRGCCFLSAVRWPHARPWHLPSIPVRAASPIPCPRSRREHCLYTEIPHRPCEFFQKGKAAREVLYYLICMNPISGGPLNSWKPTLLSRGAVILEEEEQAVGRQTGVCILLFICPSRLRSLHCHTRSLRACKMHYRRFM